MTKSDETARAAKVLETTAREYGKHSGPESTQDERDAFGRDLHTAALRYARVYYAEARELGLVIHGHNVVQLDDTPRGASGFGSTGT